MLRQLKALIFLAVGLGLIVGPFVVYHLLTEKKTPPLFALLHGPRTPSGRLLIDGSRGSFAGLRVGMPFAAALDRLPVKQRRDTSFPPSEYIYADGNGLLMDVASVCGTQVQTTIRCKRETVSARCRRSRLGQRSGMTPDWSLGFG
jgi:hypothetical protein